MVETKIDSANDRNNERKLDILSVISLEDLNDLQAAISNVTGVAFVTVDYKGDVISESTKFCNFCKHVRNDANSAMLCRMSDSFGSIMAANNKKASIYICPFGLVDIAIPIIVDDVYLGGFIGGQIICDDIPDSVVQFSKNMHTNGNLIEWDILTTELDISDIKRYSYNEVVYIVNLVELIITRLTSQHMKSKDTERNKQKEILALKEEVASLVYENRLLREHYRDVKRSTNIYYDRNIFTLLANLAIIEDADATNAAILKYLELLRSPRIDSEESFISDELKRIKAFMELTNIYQPDKVECDYIVSSEVLDCKIPAFLLMTYITAATYKFINTHESVLNLQIAIYKKSNELHIVIEDSMNTIKSLELEYLRHEMMEIEPISNISTYSNAEETEKLIKALLEIKRTLLERFDNDKHLKVTKLDKQGLHIHITYPVQYGEVWQYENNISS